MNKPVKRRHADGIQFTMAELKLIRSMCAIATANEWGEGDYMDWTSRQSKSFQNLRCKVIALMEDGCFISVGGLVVDIEEREANPNV